MSKKSIGTGITRLLFGLGKKEMKVIPYNEMTPEQFEQLDRFLGKLGFILASDKYSLTKQQSDYIFNQIKQLDLYRERIMSSKKPDFTEFIPRDKLGIPERNPDIDKVNKMTKVEPEFKGFEPKVIEGGKGKTKPGKINYDKMEEFLGVKLRGDETFEELLEIEKRMKNKDPEDFAKGGIVDLITKLRSKFGKKAITTADKIDRPAKAKLKKEFKDFQARNRQLTDEDIEDYELELGDAETWYESGMTVADAEKLVANRKAYEAQMLVDYKAGRLDPKPGEPGRREYLERKLQEAQMSGDSRLIDSDELDELTSMEFRERTMNAEGGIATMFRPKREKFIFGGGVGLKGYLKMLAEGRKTKEGKAFKGSDTLKYGNPKSQVPKFAKQFVSDKDKAEIKRLRIAQLENVLEGLKSDRQFLESYEKMANLFPEVNKLSYDMLEELLPAQHKKRFKGLTTEMLDKEILQVENVLKNLKVGKDQRALNADGGLATMFRPKLKDGGPPNPGRRTFLKLLGGLASIPIVGKLFKPATKVAKVVPLKNTTTAMPSWFPDFVEKMTIRNVGNKIDADLTVFEDPKLPGVKVYKNDDGRIAVEGQNEYYANYEINYTPPGYELIDETTGKAVRTKGEFEAVDADPIADYDGSIADYEPRTLESVDGIMSSDARRMEGYAKDVDPNKLPMKSGEGQVIENEVRAESAMDAAREAEDYVDDFADGGLATMFRKK